MINVKERNKLIHWLDTTYNKSDLYKSYKTIINNFYDKYFDLSLKEGVEYTILEQLPRKSGIPKYALVNLIASFYCSKKMFEAFLSTLDKDVSICF